MKSCTLPSNKSYKKYNAHAILKPCKNVYMLNLEMIWKMSIILNQILIMKYLQHIREKNNISIANNQKTIL